MALRDLLADAVNRAAAVERELLDPKTVRDAKLMASLGREHQRLGQVVERANALPFGLAAYAFTNSTKTATAVANEIESGMVGVNHLAISLPETPFGGIKESGYGHEGGIEGLDAYLNTKFVTQLGA